MRNATKRRPAERYWAFGLRQPHDTAGTEPHQATTRVPAPKTRFRQDGWMDQARIRAALTDLLNKHLGQPVTVGDATVEDVNGHGYLLKTLYYTGPLAWEGARVDAIYVNQAGKAVITPWI